MTSKPITSADSVRQTSPGNRKTKSQQPNLIPKDLPLPGAGSSRSDNINNDEGEETTTAALRLNDVVLLEVAANTDSDSRAGTHSWLETHAVSSQVPDVNANEVGGHDGFGFSTKSISNFCDLFLSFVVLLCQMLLNPAIAAGTPWDPDRVKVGDQTVGEMYFNSLPVTHLTVLVSVIERTITLARASQIRSLLLVQCDLVMMSFGSYHRSAWGLFAYLPVSLLTVKGFV